MVSYQRTSLIDPMRSMPGLDPLLTVTSVGSPAVQLDLLLCRRFARFLELLPVRRVLECLIVLRERFFWLALLHEHIAPRFERISPVRPLLIGELELRRRAIEIPVLRQCDAPRVVARWKAGGQFHGLGIPLLRARPVAAHIQ